MKCYKSFVDCHCQNCLGARAIKDLRSLNISKRKDIRDLILKIKNEIKAVKA
jgi:hypothetical protein